MCSDALEHALDEHPMRHECGHWRAHLAVLRAQAAPARNVQMVRGSTVRRKSMTSCGGTRTPEVSRGAVR